MIWFYVALFWWLVHHGVNWYGCGAVLLCVVLIMWWAIVNDRVIRKPLSPRDRD